MINLSKYLGLGGRLEEEGIFDLVLNKDAPYFINIKRLAVSSEKEFADSYAKIQEFFRQIYKLLSKAKDKDSRLYKEAEKRFQLHEINNLGLGYSKSINGNAFGKELIKNIVSDAKEIIDAGNSDLELFELIGLFTDKVGPDRLSDMYSNLILDDIIEYTLNKYKVLGISKENFPKEKFEDGFLINPYKEKPVLLLPKNILQELPVAKEWEDVDYVCTKNQVIRNEINRVVADEWSEMTVSEKKKFVKEHVMKHKNIFDMLVKQYKQFSVDEYDFQNDPVGFYIITQNLDKIDIGELEVKSTYSPKDIVLKICEKFKDLVENNALSKLLYDNNGKSRGEKSAQLLFYGIASSFCEANNIDCSPELNSGRGNIDFKFSKGYTDKIIVEMKLTSNQQLVHGLTVQIMEYAKAEKTDKLIYLVIDDSNNEKRIEKMYKAYNDMKIKSDLIFVDAIPKASASTF